MCGLVQAIRDAVGCLCKLRKKQPQQGPTPYQEKLMEDVLVLDNVFTQWSLEYERQGGDFMVAWIMRQERLTPTQAAETLKQRRAYRAKQLQAYCTMHAELKQRFLGQYVAIHNGEVVDHDPDRWGLFLRLDWKYRKQALIMLVEDDAES